ncbi:MAG TPA: outer membrane lipoprotein carrier protein LolA [Polyangiaceae bacterium]|nr:outer membrane lipoprotein carrier protein LolA [Polyangiaceae bacterium]
MRRFLAPPIALIVCAVSLCGFGGLGGDARVALADSPPPAQPPGASQGVDAAVASVQSFYDRSTTFRSDFQQKFWVKAYNREKSSRGHVTFSKPGKMDWVYEDPVGNRVVSDGSVIKVYEAGNKQMYEEPIDKSQYPAALSFLTGTGKLTDSFTFQLVSGAEMKFPGGYVLVGTPKQPTSAYSKVLFYVDAATSQVRRVMVIDGQGNRNRFDFVDPKVNEPVAPAQFSFTPPPGTSVIHP